MSTPIHDAIRLPLPAPSVRASGAWPVTLLAASGGRIDWPRR